MSPFALAFVSPPSISSQIIERRNELITRTEEERKRFTEDYFRMGDFVEEQNQLFGKSLTLLSAQLCWTLHIKALHLA